MKIGDLVMVETPNLCCGDAKYLKRNFIIANLKVVNGREKSCCEAAIESEEMAYDATISTWFGVGRLKVLIDGAKAVEDDGGLSEYINELHAMIRPGMHS